MNMLSRKILPSPFGVEGRNFSYPTYTSAHFSASFMELPSSAAHLYFFDCLPGRNFFNNFFSRFFFHPRPGEEKFVSSSYVIESMDRHKGGTYICTANNGVGQVASSQIMLHVLCKYKEHFSVEIISELLQRNTFECFNFALSFKFCNSFSFEINKFLEIFKKLKILQKSNFKYLDHMNMGQDVSCHYNFLVCAISCHGRNSAEQIMIR